MRRNPSRSCTSVDRAGSTAVGTSGWLVREPARQPLLAVDDGQPVGVQSQQSGGQSVVLARRAQPFDAGHRRVRGEVALGLAARAVDDQSGQRHRLGRSRSTKKAASRRASGSGAATTRNAVRRSWRSS